MFNRREFIEKTGAVAGGVVASSIIGKAETAKAAWEKSVLVGPTGITTNGGNTMDLGSDLENEKRKLEEEQKEKDHKEKLKKTNWRETLPLILNTLNPEPIQIKIPGIPPGIHLAGEIYERAWLVRDEPRKLVEFIPEFDYRNEPASYLIAGYIYTNPWELATAKKEKWMGNLSENDPMTHFAKEMGMYLNKYLRNQNISNKQIENPAYDAIQIASQQTMDGLIKSGINLNNKNDQNLKIIVWATAWLVNNYRYENKEFINLYNNVEKRISEISPSLRVRRKDSKNDLELYHDKYSNTPS